MRRGKKKKKETTRHHRFSLFKPSFFFKKGFDSLSLRFRGSEFFGHFFNSGVCDIESGEPEYHWPATTWAGLNF
jgi:hypothetical protein